MVGGYVKNALEQQQITCKLSLPLLAREVDMFRACILTDLNIIKDSWKLVVDDKLAIYCSMTAETNADFVLNGKNLEFTDGGDVNFL